MACDQRMIIKFLLNERINAHEIAHKIQTQSEEHVYTLRTIRFWIAQIWFGRQDLHDEIRPGQSPLDDLDAKNLARRDKLPFESAHSISKTLHVALLMTRLHLQDSLGRIHMRYGDLLKKNHYSLPITACCESSRLGIPKTGSMAKSCFTGYGTQCKWNNPAPEADACIYRPDNIRNTTPRKCSRRTEAK
jgi:hypothetical protein